jgi:hypothetical protein
MDITYPFIIIMGLTVLITSYVIMAHASVEYKRNITTKIKNLSTQYRLMDKLRDDTNIERVLILKSHNGDGVPKPGYQLKVTALYESYEPPFQNKIDAYKNLTVDGDYILMLEQVRQYGYTAFYTHDMKDSLLKRIYEDEGVFWSYVFYIGRDKHNWYFASLSTSKPDNPFTLNRGLHVELFVNKMRSLYADMTETTVRKLKRNILKKLNIL